MKVLQKILDGNDSNVLKHKILEISSSFREKKQTEIESKPIEIRPNNSRKRSLTVNASTSASSLPSLYPEFCKLINLVQYYSKSELDLDMSLIEEYFGAPSMSEDVNENHPQIYIQTDSRMNDGLLDRTKSSSAFGDKFNNLVEIGSELMEKMSSSVNMDKKRILREEEMNWRKLLNLNEPDDYYCSDLTFHDLRLHHFLGHLAPIKCIKVNEENRLLATGSRDRTIKLYSLDFHREIENGISSSKPKGSKNSHRKSVLDLDLGDSFGYSTDGTIQQWDLETLRTISSLDSNCIQLKLLSNYLITATNKNALQLML